MNPTSAGGGSGRGVVRWGASIASHNDPLSTRGRGAHGVRGAGVWQAQKNASAFKRCRIAFQKRTMTDESPRTKPEKLPKTKTELEALVLAELRAASQCGGAVH